MSVRIPVCDPDLQPQRCRAQPTSEVPVPLLAEGGEALLDVGALECPLAPALGELDSAETRQDPMFGLHVPVSVPGVDPKLLDPIQTWPDPAAFEETARKLAAAFKENFAQYEQMVSPAVVAAGPLV